MNDVRARLLACLLSLTIGFPAGLAQSQLRPAEAVGPWTLLSGQRPAPEQRLRLIQRVAAPGGRVLIGWAPSDQAPLLKAARQGRVWIGPLSAERLELSERGLTVRMPELPPGEYPVSLQTDDHRTTWTSVGTLAVLGRGRPAGDTASDARDTDYTEGEAAVALPGVALRRAQVLTRRIGARLELLSQQPLLPGSRGICGQLIGILRAPTGQSTADLLNRARLTGDEAVWTSDPKATGNLPSAGGPLARPPLPTRPSAPRLPVRPLLRPRVLVAVLDSGISNAPSFSETGQNVLDLARAANFTSEPAMDDLALERDASLYPQDLGQRVGHGTAVAALINGSAPRVRILPVKVCTRDGRCDSARVAQGICYALAQSRPALPLRVINVSLGGRQPSVLVEAALREAAQRGVTVVTAAGNEGVVPAAPSPVHYPAAYSTTVPGPQPGLPATIREIPGLLAVGSADAQRRPSAFSSWGRWVSLVSHGEQIQSIRVTDDGAGGTLFSTRAFTGTSFAAPLVSAAAAQFVTAHPFWAPVQVKQQLLQQAQPMPGCPVEQCGAGWLPTP